MSTVAPAEERARPRFRYLKRFVGFVVSVALLVVAGMVAWNYTVSGPIRPAAAADPCPTPGAPPPQNPSARSIRVNVFNATERRGLASTTAELMRARGFQLGRIANAPEGQLLPGVAELRYGRAGVLEARVVAAHLGGRGLTLVRDDRRDASVDVLIGAAFRSLANAATIKAVLPTFPYRC